MKLYKYQERNIEEALYRYRNHNAFYIFDEMGLGKTMQALMIAKSLAQRTAVVCPPFLKLNWRSEYLNAGFRGDRLCIVQPPKWEVDTDAGFFIFGYSLSQKKNGMELLKKANVSTVIFDEAHFLKNPKSGRYKFFKQVLKKSKVKSLFLTGTPIMNLSLIHI